MVAEDLPSIVKGIKIINIYDGLVHYRFDGNSRDLEKVIYFNNTFFLLKFFNQKNLNFKVMINTVASQKNYFLITKGTFRTRFVQENQFAKVDKVFVKKAEDSVLQNSRLSVDRLSPSTEIWYSIRREGFGFCGQLISKREFTEKNLNKGELRPEVAYFMCAFAGGIENCVCADFFAGYGAIPVQLAKKFRPAKLYVSDVSDVQTEILKQKKQLCAENVDVRTADAFKLEHIQDNSIDCVITDPPWGFYEDIGDIKEFYCRMFESFERVLKPEGKMVILTARTQEFEKAASEMNVQIQDSLHTLVNGKKASLYRCKPGNR